MAHEEIGEGLEHIVSSCVATDLDCQTLPRVLIDHGQELQRREDAQQDHDHGNLCDQRELHLTPP